MSLQVFCGGMFSGKTTKMIEEINKFTDIIMGNSKALIINHIYDIRNTENVISSHSSLYKGLGDNIDVISSSMLSSVDVSNYNIIGVDEINFFDDENDLVTTIKLWISMEKHIVCAGLDGDSNMNKFGYISHLLHLSNSFVKLCAICTLCAQETLNRGDIIAPYNVTPAPFTKKLVSNSSVVEIGGADKYIPVCRKHHTITNNEL